ncbi:Hpt domain-containing protein [Achromobacter seleniivolatilans]|uniref:Hpt domain-containing protein n=1 Tax=Achromobacter seleniivolatilans TaxID=3047478 RepID=A0ABY9M1E5_9BURK|nr:Hpt domain-containing protein [Achromobacter sp. R39]WMD20804.1 Hpt domain-containing protein [Achromobacter sp. R39]
MNLALIIGQRPDRLRAMSACLAGLGLATETCSGLAALQDYTGAPRVVLWDEDASDSPSAALPATVAAAPIQLWILPPSVPMTQPGIRVPPPATEAQLLSALVNAGYSLPDDAECAAISQTLHDLVDGDTAVVSELIESLFDTAKADLADYRARCAEQNWSAAGSLAHRIKGTARLAGCRSLTQLCERIEMAARLEGRTAITPLNTLFEPALDRLCAELARLRQAS